MDEEKSIQFAKQMAQNSYNSIKQILQQYGVQLQAQQQAQQQAIQSVSKKSASLSHFGFICEDMYIISLNISGKGLEILPESIGDLIRLRFLDLNNNKLEELPESIGNRPQFCQQVDSISSMFSDLDWDGKRWRVNGKGISRQEQEIRDRYLAYCPQLRR